MRIYADFSLPASAHAEELDWLPSPMAGVDRRMLDRIGNEVARATTIVRYAPGSNFAPHTHAGGEEFIVLEGIFQDEHGDYPTGTYVRNPPTSQHKPSSKDGCVIFVKLNQFALEDRTFSRIETNKMKALADPDRHGVKIIPLFQDNREYVRIEEISSNTSFRTSNSAGFEMLVLSGSLVIQDQQFVEQSWLRLPPGNNVQIQTGDKVARIWVKTGHLRREILKSGTFANEDFGV